MYYLYMITNQINGKQYIGISNNPARRWIKHKSGHGSKIVYQAIKKYGLENLKFDVLYEGCEDDIKQLEISLIKEYNTFAPNGYNLTEGGEGSIGWKPSAKTRQKWSESRSGKKNGMHGKKHSKETKAKISAKAKGRKNPTRSRLNKQYQGAKNPRAKKICVNGIWYNCIKEAAEALNVHWDTLRRHLKKAGSNIITYIHFDRVANGKVQGLKAKGRQVTSATRKKMSEARKGAKSPIAQKILVNNKKYGCIKDAAKAENINYSTLRDRIRRYSKSGRWPKGWAYL